jgi:hypothetical protein
MGGGASAATATATGATAAGAGAVTAATVGTAAVTTSTTTAVDDPFPKLGLTLAAFQQFIDMHGGRQSLDRMTTTDVCEEILKKSVFERDNKQELWKLSYCDLLVKEQSSQVGTATCFVS